MVVFPVSQCRSPECLLSVRLEHLARLPTQRERNLERAERLTPDEAKRMAAAWGAANGLEGASVEAVAAAIAALPKEGRAGRTVLITQGAKETVIAVTGAAATTGALGRSTRAILPEADMTGRGPAASSSSLRRASAGWARDPAAGG